MLSPQELEVEEQRLYNKICEILSKNDKDIPTGFSATIKVGFMLADIQKKCTHSNGYEVFIDLENVTHTMCVDCIQEKTP